MSYERPDHYTKTDIDAIAAAKANFTREEVNGFFKVNILKYTMRADRKNGIEDLYKARDYQNMLIESYEEVAAEADKWLEDKALEIAEKMDITPERGVVKVSDLYHVINFPRQVEEKHRVEKVGSTPSFYLEGETPPGSSSNIPERGQLNKQHPDLEHEYQQVYVRVPKGVKQGEMAARVQNLNKKDPGIIIHPGIDPFRTPPWSKQRMPQPPKPTGSSNPLDGILNAFSTVLDALTKGAIKK
jgi:Protein of unknwon function (DUF3310)